MTNTGPAFTRGERLRIGASLMAPFAVLWLLSRRHWIPLPSLVFVVAGIAALVAGAIWPRAFAGWHRAFSDAQAWVGRRLVMLLLGLVFVLVVAPFGVLLRLMGKSFLELGRADSYWKKPRPGGSLRDQF